MNRSYRINPKTGRVVTSAGIEIGRAHQGAPARIGQHAEIIQSALLTRPKPSLLPRVLAIGRRLVIGIAGH